VTQLSTPPLSSQRSAEKRSVPSSLVEDLDPDQVTDLVAANRILAHYGIFDAYGHVSVRSRKNADRYLMTRYMAPSLVTEADITVYDLDSKPLDPGITRSFSERFIHGEIYRARPDVMAVVHNHSPGVIPFSLSDKPLLPVMHMGAFLRGGVPVYDSAKYFPDADMMVRNPEGGRALAQVLGKKSAALMCCHGIVIAANNLRLATARSYYAEVNAKAQAQAMALGGTVRSLTENEARNAEAAVSGPPQIDRAWDLWVLESMRK
jgi:ribulose-5-phosphate 4-epimerase/fuculose-1-phosphate aldolase